jgi:hypothetical protein
MTYDPEMEEFDKSFDDAEEPEDGFREVPEGTYQAYVDRAVFDQPDWADYRRLQLTCKIISGPYEGATVFPSANVNPDYIKYLKAMLIKMGMDPVPRPSEILGRLPDMLNRILEVYVAKKKEGSKYANCYVNRFVKMLGDRTSDDEPPPHSDADDPTGGW